ncbi:MAG: hypothetical protein R3199_01080 [Gemmatimonadota bacterium]|nr:hypothetical protein [Gemmatimonadota bacterium]
MKRVATPFAAMAFLLALGCVSIEATRFDSASERDPVPPDQVVIFRTLDQVPGKYAEMGVLRAEDATTWTRDMYDPLRRKAGEMGANAVVLDGVEGEGPGARALAIYLYSGFVTEPMRPENR